MLAVPAASAEPSVPHAQLQSSRLWHTHHSSRLQSCKCEGEAGPAPARPWLAPHGHSGEMTGPVAPISRAKTGEKNNY